MLGLFVLALSVTGIARMAKTRGASSWRYGLLAGVGWFVVGVLTAAPLPSLGFGSSTGELTNGGTFIASPLDVRWTGCAVRQVQNWTGRRGAIRKLELSTLPYVKSELRAEMRKLRRVFRRATYDLTGRCT
jgi:hypothetical protein